VPGYRLPRGGTRIDRSRPLRFSFDGASVPAMAGDTVASALIASGRTLVGRSFKYHRPRGIYTAGAEEPNALVTLGAGPATEPNAKATVVDAADGMLVRSQNAWPSLRTDFGAVSSFFGPLLGAGFYYKTFMGPFRGAWMLYEPFIRRAAGLGRATFAADPDRYETTHAFCDVLVVGAGPAGIAAALAAAQSGARVVLCDDAPVPGGMLDLEDSISSRDPAGWIFENVSALDTLPNALRLKRTTVYGYFDDNVLGAVEQVASGHGSAASAGTRQRHWRIEAKRVVLATGALERPFVFPGNDLPGVMLASAGLAYARRHGVAVGREAAVFTNNDSGWRRAAALARAGVTIRAVVDPRSEVPGRAASELADSGTQILTGQVVGSARGSNALKSIRVHAFDTRTGQMAGNSRDIRCDALLVSAGWNPLVHLASQAGATPIYDEGLAAFVPGEPREAWLAAGAIRGTFGSADAAAAGTRAGTAAVQALSGGHGQTNGTGIPIQPVEKRSSDNLLPIFEIPTKGKPSSICRTT
jgi:sarcosine oxidase subunit alpha